MSLDDLSAWRPDAALIHKLFKRSTFERGLLLAAQGCILRMVKSGQPGMPKMTATVQGSAPTPYDVSITVLNPGSRPVFQCVCTCPVTFGCKHAAGVLYAWSRSGGNEDGASPLVLGWVQQMRALHQGQHTPAVKQAKPARERLFYTLDLRSFLSESLPMLTIGKAMLGDDGLPAGRETPWRNVEQAMRRPFSFMNEADLHAVRLLWLYLGVQQGDWGDTWRLPAQGGADIVRALAQTGRLRLVCDDGAKRLATLNTQQLLGTLVWCAQGSGRTQGQCPKVALADAGVQATSVLVLDTPWYADLRADRVTLGPLQVAGVDADSLRLLLALPPLNPHDAALVAQTLGEVSPELPRPQLSAVVQATPMRLAPTLLLNTWRAEQGLRAVNAHRGHAASNGADDQPSFSFARVQWLYTEADAPEGDPLQCRFEAEPPLPPGSGAGSDRAGPADAGWQFAPPAPAHYAAARDGRLLKVERDHAAETAALAELLATGLQPLLHGSLLLDAPPAHALWGQAQEADWADFFSATVPALQRSASGWRVFIDGGFAHRVRRVQAWHASLDDDPSQRTGGWLLGLGIEVAGQRLDLAPLLAALLERDPRWSDRTFLQTVADDTPVRMPGPDNIDIEAPAGRIKPLLLHLVDLFDHVGDGGLRISRWDALRLSEALDAARWQFKDDAALQTLARQLRDAGSVRAVKPPRGLGLALRPYQLEGLAWLQYLRAQNLSGILADDMGLGKTAQTLAHLLIEKQARRLDRPALVVLPTTLVFNWQAEAARIAPKLRLLNLHGADRAERFADIARHDLVLTTYPLLWRDADKLAEHEYHLLILDEAQSVKNAASKGAEAVRQIRARHRLCLTGTPLENHLGELWAQFDFLMPGFLGDDKSFARQWRTPIEKHGQALRSELLARRVRPFILRRRKDDVAQELPAKTTIVRRVPLQGQQRELYEAVRIAVDEQLRQAIAARGLARSQIAVLDALLKLRQVCCDPRLVKGAKVAKSCERAKLELLAQMLPELVAEGRRVLLFSQFTEMLALIEAELPAWGIPWLKLTGDSRDRGDLVRRFQAGEAPLFLISLKAGGVGLNLTAADTVIHFDPWWNPAAEAQATDRAHRIGQDKPVFVYKLVAEGSIEERILSLQERKAELAAQVLGADAAGATKFGDDDIAALLAPLG